MKTKLILLALSSLSLLNCTTSSQNKGKYDDFREGEFLLLAPEINRFYVIERYADYQIEKTFELSSSNKLLADKYFFIKWISDDQYQLLIDSNRSELTDEDANINASGGMMNRIKKRNANCFTVVTTLLDFSLESEICKKQMEIPVEELNSK